MTFCLFGNASAHEMFSVHIFLLTFTCSKTIIETYEKGVKYAQSEQLNTRTMSVTPFSIVGSEQVNAN